MHLVSWTQVIALHSNSGSEEQDVPPWLQTSAHQAATVAKASVSPAGRKLQSAVQKAATSKSSKRDGKKAQQMPPARASSDCSSPPIIEHFGESDSSSSSSNEIRDDTSSTSGSEGLPGRGVSADGLHQDSGRDTPPVIENFGDSDTTTATTSTTSLAISGGGGGGSTASSETSASSNDADASDADVHASHRPAGTSAVPDRDDQFGALDALLMHRHDPALLRQQFLRTAALSRPSAPANCSTLGAAAHSNDRLAKAGDHGTALARNAAGRPALHHRPHTATKEATGTLLGYVCYLKPLDKILLLVRPVAVMFR